MNLQVSLIGNPMDPELSAMQAINDALEPLDEEAIARVLKWAWSKNLGQGLPDASSLQSNINVNEPVDAQSFGEFYHQASPETGKDRAATSAYWIQVKEGAESFGSQSLNAMLKDLGYGVANITDALNQCMKENPKLVIQMKKSGTSKQARKTYKLTDAGRRHVEAMLEKGSSNG